MTEITHAWNRIESQVRQLDTVRAWAVAREQEAAYRAGTLSWDDLGTAVMASTDDAMRRQSAAMRRLLHERADAHAFPYAPLMEIQDAATGAVLAAAGHRQAEAFSAAWTTVHGPLVIPAPQVPLEDNPEYWKDRTVQFNDYEPGDQDGLYQVVGVRPCTEFPCDHSCHGYAYTLSPLAPGRSLLITAYPAQMSVKELS